MDFNRIYKKNKNIWGQTLNRPLQIVLKRVGLGSWFLDLGSGQGRDSLLMARKGFKVIAVDSSIEGIADLELAANKYDLCIKMICQDIKKFEIERNKYSIINISYVLHFLKKRDAVDVLIKAKERLKVGGFMVVNSLTIKDPLFIKKENRNQGFFRTKELLELFSDFNVILHKEFSVADSGHAGFVRPHCHQIVELVAQKP